MQYLFNLNFGNIRILLICTVKLRSRDFNVAECFDSQSWLGHFPSQALSFFTSTMLNIFICWNPVVFASSKFATFGSLFTLQLSNVHCTRPWEGMATPCSDQPPALSLNTLRLAISITTGLRHKSYDGNTNFHETDLSCRT